jgi:predicted RNA-binding Zn ribbon-like protein
LLGNRSTPPFLFVSGHACLDFINTRLVVNGRLTDLLETFLDLVEWLVQAGLVERQQAAAVSDKWGGTPEAEQALQGARALRGVLHQMVQQIAAGQEVPAMAIAAINRLLRDQQGHPYVDRQGTTFVRRFERVFLSPEHLLVPIAEAAADLLTNRDFSRIRKCENPECVLYFYDTSKSHTRRWCSMSLCGNRLKVARHYHRQHPS